MKPRQAAVSLLVLMIVCSSAVIATDPAVAADSQPAAFYDTWTSVKALEDGKAFSSLAAVLESLLTVRTADPAGNVKRAYDPEGVAYLLDDLAEIYAKRLVDFKRAASYNERAFALHDRLHRTGLSTIPISDYFTQRRSLYYYIQVSGGSRRGADERAVTDLPLGSLFKQQPEVVTLFPDRVITAVRLADFEGLGDRVAKRRAYLSQKLGLSPLPNPLPLPEDLFDELALIKDLLQNLGVYNNYYRNVYLAEKLWFIHRQGGPVDYREFAALCRAALDAESDQRLPDDLDSSNLLNYWAGISYLKLGDQKDGTYHLRRFFRGLEDIDDLAERLAKTRKRVLGRAIEERERAWENFAIVLNVAGLVASAAVSVAGQLAAQGIANSYAQATYYSVQQAMAAREAAQQTIQGIAQQMLLASAAATVGTVAGSLFSEERADLETEDTRKLAGLVTPLALKAARYLDKFDQVELFTELGRAYEALGQDGKAVRFYGEALAIIEAQRSTISAERQRISFAALKEDTYKRIISLLVKHERVGGAFEYVERAKARAFLDVLASRQGLVLKTTRDTERFHSLLRAKDEVSALLDQRQVGLEQVTSVLSRLGRDLQVASRTPTDSAEIEVLTEAKVITAEEAGRLAQGEFSILEYFVTDTRVHVFLIDSGRLFASAVDIDDRRLFDLISALRASITDPQAPPKSLAPVELYDILLRPLRHHISKRRLYVIPHGWLHSIPFQTLRDSATGRYVVEDFAITYSPSTTVLKHVVERSRTSSRDSIIVFANADLGDRRFDLPSAEEEAIHIASTFKHSRVLMRHEATESLFKQHAEHYDIVHIASHAHFDVREPLRSAVLLSSDAHNDGRLEVTELYQLRLKATLVVLSACQTGLAYVVRGDELIGLVRGVMYSGADTVLSTLWSVEDSSTAELMKLFYQALDTQPKDLALQSAQLTLMRRFPQPFNWAPFVLMGNPN